MFKLIKIIFSLVVILIATVVVLPFLIPLESYKKEAVVKLSEMTGREIRIDGAMRLKLLPNISIALNDVMVGNPKGFSTPYLAKISALNVDVSLKPLLNKHVEIHRLTLDKPDIHLEVLANGKSNWEVEFKAPSLPKLPTTSSLSLISDANAQAKQSAPSSFSLDSLNLSGFSVANGKLTYKDAKSKTNQKLEAINLKADAVAVGKPLGLDGSFQWNGDTFSVAAKAASLKSIMDKKPTQIALKVNSSHIKIDYAGLASAEGINGKINAGSPSLKAMMKWLGNPMDYNKTSLLFSTEGNINCTTTRCNLTKSKLAIDGLRFAGDVGVQFGGKIAISGNLKTDVLDVTPYMDTPKTALNEWSNPFISNALAAGGHWDTKPFDVSALGAVNADVSLAAGKLIAPPWNIYDVNLKALLQNGAATLDIEQAKLFDGSINGAISVTPRDNYINTSVNMNASNVQIEPLLKTLNNDDRISGTGTLKLAFTGRGKSQSELMSTLSGNGSVMIRDGAIKGINLAEMARNVQSAFKQVERGSQKTDFAELGGTYTIASGVISNKDLSMKAPFVRLKGEGKIDLPNYTINYRLLPEIVNTRQGQDGKDKVGIVVPILVSGALDNPQFAPDLQSIIQDAINNPEKLKENVKAVKEQIKEHKQEIKEIKQDFKQIKEDFKDPKKLLENPDAMNKVNDLLNQFR
jgi:AsmA protein